MTPETPSDPPRRRLAVPTGELVWTEEGGAGPETGVFLAIPGLPGSVRDFRWLAPAIPGGRRFLRVELPGFGEADRHELRGLSSDQRAAAVEALLTELDLRELTLISHSSGALVAARLARRCPDRIDSLALLASPGPTPHYPLRTWRAKAALLRRPLGRRLLRAPMRALYSAFGFPSYLTDRELVCTSLDAAAVDFAEWRDDLRALTIPTLIASAPDDRLIAPRRTRALEELAPDGPRLRFEDGGHNIQKTRATELGEALDALRRELASSVDD